MPEGHGTDEYPMVDDGGDDDSGEDGDEDDDDVSDVEVVIVFVCLVHHLTHYSEMRMVRVKLSTWWFFTSFVAHRNSKRVDSLT